jgi:hypothetical protein
MRATTARLTSAAIAASMTACAINHSDETNGYLNPSFIKRQYGASAYPDIEAGSRCTERPKLSVIVIEDRKGSRSLSGFPPVAVTFEDISATMERYFADALHQSNVQTVVSGGTEVRVRIEDMTMTTGWGPAAGSTTLAVSVPAWGHTGSYLGEEVSGSIPRGIAYSMHMSVLKFLADPQVLRRLQCRDM